MGGGCGYGVGVGWEGGSARASGGLRAGERARARRRRRLPPRSPQALLQCVGQLTISGEIAGRMLTRMAEVLEGRHTDAEIAEADVTVWRDFAQETVEQQKRRVSQHSLFVQVDGTGELMRYLLLHIPLSPTAYAPTGVGARVLNWARERQREKDMHMMGLAEQTMDLPDIKLEGYEYLFTESLHRIPELATEGHEQADAGRSQAELDKSTGESISVAAAFRTLLALLRYGTDATKRAVLAQLRDKEMLRSLICLAAEITQERWYPANAGTNLLLIMQDICKLPPTALHEVRSSGGGGGREGREEVTGGRRWREEGRRRGGEEEVGRRQGSRGLSSEPPDAAAGAGDAAPVRYDLHHVALVPRSRRAARARGHLAGPPGARLRASSRVRVMLGATDASPLPPSSPPPLLPTCRPRCMAARLDRWACRRSCSSATWRWRTPRCATHSVTCASPSTSR